MKVLVTGFDPFGGEAVNPAYEAVKRLPKEIAGAVVTTIEIPTVYWKSGIVLEKSIMKEEPDVVLCVGQAGGRSNITVEKVAINLAEARIKDNEGAQPIDKPLEIDGAAAYFASIPVKAIVGHMKRNGIPANISYTAGTFVCNDVMYHLLYMIDKKYKRLKGGFIHVPFAPEQVIDKPDGTPSMSVEMITKGLECAIEAIALGRNEDHVGMGTIL
ncbi:MAG: pyroglutamyl-peptidase I [Lachnospiraceae bacterium]